MELASGGVVCIQTFVFRPTAAGTGPLSARWQAEPMASITLIPCHPRPAGSSRKQCAI
jgi:hypothetical protein